MAIRHTQTGVTILETDAEKAAAADLMTCGACGRSWDNVIGTVWTPVPAGRCPFEYDHVEKLTTETLLEQHGFTIDDVEAAVVQACYDDLGFLRDVVSDYVRRLPAPEALQFVKEED